MSIQLQMINLKKTIGALDLWAEETFKASAVYNLFSKLTLPHKGISRFGFLLLSVFVFLLFVSLILPMFSSDRFGIGIIILFAVLSLIIYLISTEDLIIKYSFLDFLLLSFLAIAVIGTFTSYFFFSSCIGLVKYLLLFSTYFMFKVFIQNSRKSRSCYFLPLLFSGLLVSAIGILQYFEGVEPLAGWSDSRVELTRVYSTLGNPNLLGGFLLLLTPTCFLLFSGSVLKKSFSLFCGGMMLMCLLMTGSRGAYLGLLAIVFSCVSIFIRHKGNKKFGLVFLAAVLALIFFTPGVIDRLESILMLRDDSSTNFRLNVWMSSFNIFLDNWLIGIGPGNITFREVYGLYMVSGFDSLSSYNVFLEIGVELGVFGLLIFLAIIFYSFAKLHFAYWEEGSIIALVIALSFVGIFTQGLFDTVFFRPQMFIPFCFYLAMVDSL